MLPRLIRSQIVKGLERPAFLMDMDGSLQILPGENDKKPVHPVDAAFLKYAG